MSSKMSASSLTGIAMTVAMGAAAAYVMSGRSETARRRAMRRSTAKAARAVGSMVGEVAEQVSGMLK